MKTRKDLTLVLCILALCALTFGGCQTRERVPEIQTVSDPLIDRVDLVDIAVLKPVVRSKSTGMLAKHAREECRKVLIERKMYSVPSDGFVDKNLSGRKLDPGRTAGVLGSDGVLEVVISDWDAKGLIPRGHIYAAGTFTLYGAGNSLWRRSFKDRKILASIQVTSSNRAEAEGDAMRTLIRDILANLPNKKTR